MGYSFHPAAEAELNDAADCYDDCEIGLGSDFLREVEFSIAAIFANPSAWPFLEAPIRHCQTRRFPYGLVYRQLTSDHIRILAVMHLHREPGYWKKRLEEK